MKGCQIAFREGGKNDTKQHVHYMEEILIEKKDALNSTSTYLRPYNLT